MKKLHYFLGVIMMIGVFLVTEVPATTQVNIYFTGTGSGTVTGIWTDDSGTSYPAQTFTNNSGVGFSGGSYTFTANSDAGSIFEGWSDGYCTGTGICTITAANAATNVSIVAMFSAETTTTTDNCAATTSGPPGQIKIPFLNSALHPSDYYSAVLIYQPANTPGIWFTMEQFIQVSTPNCTTTATVSPDASISSTAFVLTIPKLIWSASSAAVVNASVVMITNDGQYFQVTSISNY